MAKKRAFVKYTKKGKIIPGSLIVTTSGGHPVDGVYKEVPENLCCVPSFTCDSCLTLQVVGELNDTYLYGFTLQAKTGGPNLTGTVYWTPTESGSFNLPADGSNYDFEHGYDEGIVYTVRLCINNPSQIQDFELGFGPGDTVGLSNAQAIKGIDEWDSDDMNIYSLDLSGMIGLEELYHCCSVLTHINITGSVDLIDVDLENNELTEASVDHVLITLDNSGLSNGNVNLSGGTNAIPSVTGAAAAASLTGKGWNVNTN